MTIDETGLGITIANATVIGLAWDFQDLRGWDLSTVLKDLLSSKPQTEEQILDDEDPGLQVDERDLGPLHVTTAAREDETPRDTKHSRHVVDTSAELETKLDSRPVNTTEDVPF